MLWAVPLLCIPPSVQQEVGRQEAAEVQCSLLGSVWRSCGLSEYFASDAENVLRQYPGRRKECRAAWCFWKRTKPVLYDCRITMQWHNSLGRTLQITCHWPGMSKAAVGPRDTQWFPLDDDVIFSYSNSEQSHVCLNLTSLSCDCTQQMIRCGTGNNLLHFIFPQWHILNLPLVVNHWSVLISVQMVFSTAVFLILVLSLVQVCSFELMVIYKNY